MMIRRSFTFGLLAATLILAGCGSTQRSLHSISGVVQKGPFIQGSTVSVSELGRELTPDGKVFTTVTSDNVGTFTISVPQTGYAEVMSNGYYFNENQRSISSDPLTLSALVDLSRSTCNVNILTTLTKDRVRFLMLYEDASLSEASMQATQEILRFFGIPESAAADPAEMDITQSGDSNAVLLAISIILQDQRSTGEVSELISMIAADIAPDGVVDANLAYLDGKLTSALVPAYDFIEARLIDRYDELGQTVQLPDYRRFIDSRFIDSGQVLHPRLEDVKFYIVGTWQGIVSTPSWVPDYHCQITFNDDLTYSVKSVDSTPVLYYGDDADSACKTYRVTDMNDDGTATGEIAITWDYTSPPTCDTSHDQLRRISFSNGYNALLFEFWHFGQYGPVVFDLTRVP
jgi:hypothetical protein